MREISAEVLAKPFFRLAFVSHEFDLLGSLGGELLVLQLHLVSIRCFLSVVTQRLFRVHSLEHLLGADGRLLNIALVERRNWRNQVSLVLLPTSIIWLQTVPNALLRLLQRRQTRRRLYRLQRLRVGTDVLQRLARAQLFVLLLLSLGFVHFPVQFNILFCLRLFDHLVTLVAVLLVEFLDEDLIFLTQRFLYCFVHTHLLLQQLRVKLVAIFFFYCFILVHQY